MGLTSALNTSLNGLSLNETQIDVLGNNIANAGTTGFKASKVLFSTQLARTISFGSRPTINAATGQTTNGGTNPLQIGLGAQVAAITTDFSPGNISGTTSPSDLAIQGDGFFVLQGLDGPVYTRNGNFRLDSSNFLSNSQGLRVMGYGIDANFNLITTTPTQLQIPLGQLRIAQQTQNVTMGGALSPQGVVATRGTLQLSEALVDAGNGNAAITATTLLTDVRRGAATGTALFASGDNVSFAPTKGGRTVEAKTLAVTATTTVQDYLNLIDNTLGIQSYAPAVAEPDGVAFGVSVTGTGEIRIKGNRGTVNDFNLPIGSFTNNGNSVPISFTPQGNRADGESTVTAFTVYDSLGTPITVRMTAVMDSQAANRTTYRYFLESADQSTQDISVGMGTIDFDNLGRVSTLPPNGQFSLDRSSTSAVNPMILTLNFANIAGVTSTGSSLTMTNQDGTSPGTLTSYVIDDQGNINGAFDNGIIRTLGQILLSRFANPNGLIQAGGDNFKEGLSSGAPQLNRPGSGGAGTIRAGAIELSNTDIGRSLVDLIVASTNYRGNARVISSVDQLVNELLVLGRG